jgi:hypothetical protein
LLTTNGDEPAGGEVVFAGAEVDQFGGVGGAPTNPRSVSQLAGEIK